MREPRAAASPLLPIAWLVAIGVLAGCDSYRPAIFTPETSPGGIPVTPDYSTPSRVLETITAAVRDKDLTNGRDAYVRAFADGTDDKRDYQALFDDADLTAHPRWEPSRTWTVDHEKNFYGLLVRRSPWPYELTWAPYEPNGNDTDSLLHRRYTIDLIVSGSRFALTTGVADLYFSQSARAGRPWVITLWRDSRTPDPNPDSTRTVGYVRLDQR